jgi:simple sugar transport system permease protein
MNWLDAVFWEIVLGGAIRLTTPIALTALGETIAERAGTINLGVEGIMVAGAFAGIVGATFGGWPLGLVFAATVGGAFGLAVAISVLWGGANQIIVGIAVSLAGIGITTYLFQLWQPSGQSSPFVSLVPVVTVPGLVNIPFIGKALFQQSLLTYAALAAILATAYALARTRIGIVLRAVGDDPAGAAIRGIDVARVRALALVFGGALAGLGGAAITVGFLGSFTDGVIAGRGYVAIAAVIIGRWSPIGAALGALLFAFFDSLALRMQTIAGGALPVEAYSTLPYAITLIVLVLTARSRLAPRALGQAFESIVR